MFKDKYDTIVTLKMFAVLVTFFLVYVFVSNQDYHEMVDTVTPIKYNCDMLIGSWHPDIPTSIINECRKRMYNGNEKK
jgi:hypothetical protein